MCRVLATRDGAIVVRSIDERVTVHDATTLAPLRTFADAMTGRMRSTLTTAPC